MTTKSASIYDQAEFKAHAGQFRAKQKTLARRRAYYDGSVYQLAKERFMAFGPRLYKGIKALYLPLSRAVDVDAGIIPGDWALAPDAPKTWTTAIKQVFAWSDWDVDGVLYVHYGAQYGMSALKVVDLRLISRVAIKPVDPMGLYLVPSSAYDKTPAMSIYVETRHEGDGTYEYAEVITATHVRTFKDGLEHAFYNDKAEYPNELGYVPYVEVEHKKTGDPWGSSTYDTAIPLLDEVNEQASYLADIIKKHAEAQWAVIGAEAGELEKSGDNVWFIPMGGDAKPLVAPIDIAGVLSFIQEIRDQVHGSLPELAFDELKSKTNIATATLELQLMELTLKIKRCRPNYDHGLADALRKAGVAAQQMKIEGVGVLADELLAFDRERPVLPLDKETLLRLQAMEKSLEQMDMLDQQGAEGGRQPVDDTGDEPDEEDTEDDR